jgi:hypothetical protein
MKRTLILQVAARLSLIIVGLTVGTSSAQPIYQIIDIGLTGTEHTRNDGYKFSLSQQLNLAGQVRGYSTRYSGGNINLGRSAWLYNGTNTINIGLTGAEHTRNDGYKFSTSSQLNQAGQVTGYSERYSGASFLGRSAWLYDGTNTSDIGLTGTEHTGNDGLKFSNIGQLNQAGQVTGNSARYSGSTELGYSVWLYDGTHTIDIGLTGAEHTRYDGYKASSIQQLNEAGQVSGGSDRYFGSEELIGRSAWLYNGTNTIDIGLTGAEHTRNDGYKYSIGDQLNQAGQVVGSSDRYNGSNFSGSSTWLYNGTNTIDIGLTGSEHTRNDGYKFSSGQQLNQAGQVSGVSYRYTGNNSMGQSAWLYNGTSTIDTGLTGAEHTRNDGFKASLGQQLNEAGQVRGISSRFEGSTFLGRSAWLYNGTNTVNIGLTGTEHTRNDGFKFSDSQHLNQAGQVIGYADRYNEGSSWLGRSTWLYNGTSSIDVGLTGTEHTRNDGYKYSHSLQLNEAGQIRGNSERFIGDEFLGRSAWLYNGTNTVDIGLTGSEHTTNDGYKFSDSQHLNHAGQVIGFSTRYVGYIDYGQDAWVHDPTLGTIPLQLSVRSDGFAFSEASFLSDDGIALGYYRLFDGVNFLGDRAFYWSASDGLWDLGSLIDGGLSFNGWESLYRAIQSNDVGQILGYGSASGLAAGSQSVYLLTAVPEPSTSLALIGIVVLVSASRRRNPDADQNPFPTSSHFSCGD